MQHTLGVIILCVLLLLFLAGAFSPLWARKEQTREFLGRIFVWFVLSGGMAFGGVMLWTGLNGYFSDSTEPQWKVMLAVFAFILIGAGSNILYELYIKRRMELIETKKLRQRYPDSPWKWNRRWHGNSIEYSDKSEMIFSYLITAIIITLVLILLFRTEDGLTHLHEDRGDSLVFMYILIMGTIFAVRFSVSSTIRWRKFRRSSFIMSTFPGVIGGKLEGEIQTRSRHVPCDGFDLKLSCIEMDITFRKSFHSIAETVLWESGKKVRIENIRMTPLGIAFPVSFTIPANTQESESQSRERRVYWLLTAHCSGDDHGFTAAFKVPVFKVTQNHSASTAPVHPHAVEQ